MNQSERRNYLIYSLLDEQPQYKNIIAQQLCEHKQEMKRIANNLYSIPTDVKEQKKLLRALFNVRMPQSISEEFLKIQDEYLQKELSEKGIVNLSDLQKIQKDIYLWQGDITRLKVDAIVNAANSGMTGCYQPNHTCIDNCIHTFAGVQLRLACAEIMEQQEGDEPTGQAKITLGYNLPCNYILHTVGPIVNGELNDKHCEQLASCYRSCMELAEKNNCKSIAFCCISTGVFCFPNDRAAEIAVQTVKQYKRKTFSKMEVIFNVFQNNDYEIYKSLLE